MLSYERLLTNHFLTQKNMIVNSMFKHCHNGISIKIMDNRLLYLFLAISDVQHHTKYIH